MKMLSHASIYIWFQYGYSDVLQTIFHDYVYLYSPKKKLRKILWNIYKWFNIGDPKALFKPTIPQMKWMCLKCEEKFFSYIKRKKKAKKCECKFLTNSFIFKILLDLSKPSNECKLGIWT